MSHQNRTGRAGGRFATPGDGSVQAVYGWTIHRDDFCATDGATSLLERVKRRSAARPVAELVPDGGGDMGPSSATYVGLA